MFNFYYLKAKHPRYKLIILFWLLLGLSIFLLTGCGILKGSQNPMIDKVINITEDVYPQDNKIENAAEDWIYNSTGLKTDLSPASPEPDRFK
jgi:hypothetical protein